MFAVVESGGKQYRVSRGSRVTLERLTAEVGESVTFDDVLLLADGDKATVYEASALANVKVLGKVVSQHRGEKLLIFKKRRRKNSRRKNGHRQYLTEVEITSIEK